MSPAKAADGPPVTAWQDPETNTRVCATAVAGTRAFAGDCRWSASCTGARHEAWMDGDFRAAPGLRLEERIAVAGWRGVGGQRRRNE